MRSIIAKEGYSKIVLAENGRQLEDVLEKRSPYAVFLDISLPDADGLKLLQKIKTQDAGNPVWFLFRRIAVIAE
ncbi:MAG: response regulator [Acetatifactor sp.]|nr:response regulator [Acetatifactor sp.]MDE7044199.1 response regulator [Acetatifactor sp.]